MTEQETLHHLAVLANTPYFWVGVVGLNVAIGILTAFFLWVGPRGWRWTGSRWKSMSQKRRGKFAHRVRLILRVPRYYDYVLTVSLYNMIVGAVVQIGAWLALLAVILLGHEPDSTPMLVSGAINVLLSTSAKVFFARAYDRRREGLASLEIGERKRHRARLAATVPEGH